ncbi:MAG: single-stranded-DNA-specific exonuclease RecJ [Nevskia sp.]|nr:single-stranded-DNA-specific exonuclease RecJ [Nevskia sp.]
MLIRRRPPGDAGVFREDLHPVLRRVYAARGVAGTAELSLELADLLAPGGLLGIEPAVALLEQALARGERIVVAGDYDADGATATAVAVLGLRALGAAQVDYVVPNRFTMGYGLSPAVVELARAKGAELLVTVDNGIASLAGVAAARAAGIRVLVTDHHLAGPQLPAADAIVNPNQPGCGFASKNLAGVGVMFYVLLALRARLRAAGGFQGRAEPNLAELLDLVALGTVADVVRLDRNNRVLVAQGLRRLRAGRARPGLLALLEAAGRDRQFAGSAELGFVLGPRLNAAGRLDDMTVGIECLLAPTPEAARPLAAQLDRLNRERREIEVQMREQALELVEDAPQTGVCLFDPQWHEGLVGLVASRVKERLHRPVIAFAPAAEAGLLKGSGRSIAGLHLRDALAAIDARQPGLILRFGGHAMAAGLSLPAASLDTFAEAFDRHCAAALDEEALQHCIDTDGELSAAELCIDTARVLEGAGPWGQGFPEPHFEGEFDVVEARPIGADGRHVKYRLRQPGGGMVEAPDFDGAARMAAAGGRVRLVYRLAVNRFRGLDALELQIDQMQVI